MFNFLSPYEPVYQSLESNQIQPNSMTNLHSIFPETNQKCYKCISENATELNTKQTVLNRGLYADSLEPEYYRYNKTLRFQEDEITRKYLQYKPRYPKCPIVFNNLYPFSQKNNEHLFKNPLYNYPIDESLRETEFQIMTKSSNTHKQNVKNLINMMKEMDETHITY
jgi:hypothetical protein